MKNIKLTLTVIKEHFKSIWTDEDTRTMLLGITVTAMCIIIGLMTSCTKVEPEPIYDVCNCGYIQSDNVSNYSILVTNRTTYNDTTVFLSQSDWMSAYPGDDICLLDDNNEPMCW